MIDKRQLGRSGVLAALVALFPLTGWSQLPIERDRYSALLEDQARELFIALREPVRKAAESTVEVRVWKRPVAYGVVVERERVLSKWSEVSRDGNSLSCRSGEDQWRPAKVLGVYRDEDLVLLEVPGLDAPALDLTPGDPLELGSFLAMARPDGEAAVVGVVSVLPRSLRASDQGFLGIQLDQDFAGPGVYVLMREGGSAADRAGILPDDVILKIDDVHVNGGFEIKSVLQNIDPGDAVSITYRRGQDVFTRKVALGAKPSPPRISKARMDRMNNLGGIHQFSRVKGGFRNVLQTDMPLKPADCGAPVVDLNGSVVGIAIARAARIESYILPAVELVGLLERDPAPVSAAELAGQESTETRFLREFLRESGQEPTDREIQRHREEWRRLMDEMEDLEP